LEVFVARQPIFDKNLNVFAYELLFRVGRETAYKFDDEDFATSSVISDSFVVIGIDTLTRGKKAFINFTKNLLMKETATILPKRMLVIEILENVEPDSGIITACKKLRDMGYTLALDDFVFEEKFTPLIKLAEIIKIDVLLTPLDEIPNVMKKCVGQNIKFLAEKVETKEAYQEALKIGFSYFQGYFFSKPVIISHKDIPSYKMNYIKMLKEANDPKADFNKIEAVIKIDVSMSYKLLRFINSAFFGFKTKINSIKQALVLLGLREFRKWLSLIIMKNLGADKPDELTINSIIRARFCELLSEDTKFKERSAELFFLGLFSLIDVFLSQPMSDVLDDLPLSNDVKQTLMGTDSVLSPFLNIVKYYEKADWEKIFETSQSLGIDSSKISEKYLKSLEFTNQLFVSLPS
jgi:c-di-GMP-related signal transduction protein